MSETHRSGWPIALSASAWMLIAVLLVPAWAGLAPEQTTDDQTLSTLRGQGADLADTGSAAPYPPVLLLVVAVLLALSAVAVALRLRAARYPAVVLAAVAIVLLALGARWETVPAMILLVIGTVPLLTTAAVRQMR